VTWDTLSSVASTWDTLPDIPWDSQSWQASGRALAIFDTSHNLKTLTGSGEDSGLITGDIGDDEGVSTVTGVVLRFQTEPTTATVTGQTKTGAGASAVAAGSGSLADSKFDILQTGRFHRFSFLFTGNTEVSAEKITMRLNETIQLSKETLIQSLYEILQASARKINGLAAGAYSARDNQLSAAPTTGTWAKGDFVENSNAVEAGSSPNKYILIGWRCTVGGTPGTWLECRVLTGN
jgi:hypothetical protein